MVPLPLTQRNEGGEEPPSWERQDWGWNSGPDSYWGACLLLASEGLSSTWHPPVLTCLLFHSHQAQRERWRGTSSCTERTLHR